VRVTIVGAGRLGKSMAVRLAPHFELVVIDSDARRAAEVGEELAVQASGDLRDAAESDVVLLAVPAESIDEVGQQLLSLLPAEAVVADMATGHVSSLDSNRIVSCTVIGHAIEIQRGTPAVFVIRPAVPSLVSVLSHLGDVLEGDPLAAAITNRAVCTAIARAYRDITQDLGSFDPRLIRAALVNMGAGTLKALADGQAGPFLKRLLQEMELQGN